MSKFFSARVFTVAFCLGYTIAVYIDLPLFRYYPLVTRFSLHDLVDRTLGPAMSWYGWIGVGVVAGTLAAAVVPKSIGNRIPAAVFWILPVVMFIAGFYREQQWFF